MKPRGRPPLAPDQTSVNVHFRLTEKAYDRTTRQAAAERLSLAEWFRRAVEKQIRRRK